jgi:hypothetical protein
VTFRIFSGLIVSHLHKRSEEEKITLNVVMDFFSFKIQRLEILTSFLPQQETENKVEHKNHKNMCVINLWLIQRSTS